MGQTTSKLNRIVQGVVPVPKIFTKMMAASGPEAANAILLPGSPAAGSAVFVDTNVLLYASFPELPLAAIARTRMNVLREDEVSFWNSRQVLREFLAAATRPGALAASSPIAEIVDSAIRGKNN